MAAQDERQTQDERTVKRERSEDAREEYTTYRETGPRRPGPEEAEARREADLQPAPTREGEEAEGGADQASNRRAAS